MISRFKREKDQNGAIGLVTVVGTSVILLSILLLVSVATPFSSAVTTQRANQQKTIDYSESGLDAALFAVANGQCDPKTGDVYQYNIYSSSREEMPNNPDSVGVQPGCGDGTSKWLLIQSVGNKVNTAKAYTTNAVYRNPKSTDVILPEAVRGDTMALSNSKVRNAAGSTGQPNIGITSGTLNCTSTLDANVRQSTTFGPRITGTCVINGNLYSAGAISASNTTVNGTAYSKMTSTVKSDPKTIIKNNDTTAVYDVTSYPAYTPDISPSIRVRGDQCSIPAMAELIKNETQNIMLDVTSCNGGFMNVSPQNFVLNSDVTIYSERPQNFSEIVVKTKGSKSNKLNFIFNTSGSGSGNFTNIKYEDGTSGILFGNVSLSVIGSDITGQIYGTGYTYISNTKLQFKPIALPGATNPVSSGKLEKSLVRLK